MPKRHIFNKNSTLVVKRLKYLFWSHTVLSISKLRDVAKAVKSLEIPAFPKLIFQDWFCVISFLDAQDILCDQKRYRTEKPRNFNGFRVFLRPILRLK